MFSQPEATYVLSSFYLESFLEQNETKCRDVTPYVSVRMVLLFNLNQANVTLFRLRPMRVTFLKITDKVGHNLVSTCLLLLFY